MSDSLVTALPLSHAAERPDLPVRVAEDAPLFASFLRGDDTAAIKVFRRYNRRLFLYCAKMVGSTAHAEDLTQEIWERMIRLRPDPPAVNNPAAFLLRAARNACINHIRSRRSLLPLSALEESAHPSETQEGEINETEELVLRGLDRLPLKLREVMVLNVYCGYRFDEIAEMLGKTPDAIWARASRARAQLRALVAASLARNGDDTSSDGGRQ